MTARVETTFVFVGDALKKFEGREFPPGPMPAELGAFHQKDDVITFPGVAAFFVVTMRKIDYEPTRIHITYVVDLLPSTPELSKLRVVK